MAHVLRLMLCTTITIAVDCLPSLFTHDFESFIDRLDIRFLVLVQTSDQLKRLDNGIKTSQLWKYLSTKHVRVGVAELESFAGVEIDNAALFLSIDTVTNLTYLAQNSEIRLPLFLYSKNETEIPNHLHLESIPYKSRVHVIFRDIADEKRLLLQEIYHITNQSSKLSINTVAERTENDGKPAWRFDETPEIRRRQDLQGAKIKIVYPYFMFEENDPTGGIARFFRITEKLILHSMQPMNASAERVVAKDYQLLGEPDADGNWKGVIGHLQRREGDITVIGISVSVYFSEVVDTTLPYSYALYRLYFRKPEVTYSIETMLRGFTVSLWLVCCSTLLLLSASIWLVSYIYMRTIDGHEQRYTFSECMLLTIGDYCVKGWERLPKSAAGNILCICSVLQGYLINMYYISQLQATLTVRLETMPFHDLEGMIAKNYGILMSLGSLPFQDASSAKSGIMKRVNDLMLKRRDFAYTNQQSALERVCAERLAIMAMSVVVESAAPFVSCALSNTKQNFYLRDVTFPVQKGFAFNSLLSYYMRRYLEGGLYIRDNFTPKFDEVDVEFEVIELIDVIPFLMLYGATLALSTFILLLENLYFRCTKR